MSPSKSCCHAATGANLQQPAEDLLHGAAAVAVGAAAPMQRLSCSAQNQVCMPLQQPRVPEANAMGASSPMRTLQLQSDGLQSTCKVVTDFALLMSATQRGSSCSSNSPGQEEATVFALPVAAVADKEAGVPCAGVVGA